MVISKIAFKRNVEKVCAVTHIAVTVESVREFRQVFNRKLVQKQVDKEELKKPPQKGKVKREIKPQFCPDAETDIPQSLQEYSKEINAFFAE